MKKHTILILAALLVLSAVGTAGAQDSIDARPFAQAEVQWMGPSPYDLVAPFGRIDMQDTLPIQLAITQRPAEGKVPWAWDINHDGIIDIIDLGMVAARQGCTVVNACYW